MRATTSKTRRIASAALAAALLTVAATATSTSAAKPAGKPRLSVAALDPPPAAVEAGGTVTLRGAVRNRGKRNYAGRDNALRVSVRTPSVERKLDTGELKKVKAGKARKFKVPVTFPARLASLDGGPEQPYALRVCVRKRGNAGRLRCRTAKGKITVTAPAPPGNPGSPGAPAPNPGPSFSPGARSLGDSLFPQIGNGGYDALSYLIDLDYDPATNSFAAGTSTSITAKATQNLSELSLDFQRDLTVSAVAVDGKAAAFSQVDATPRFSSNPDVSQPGKLVVTPASGITSGTKFTVKVSYSGIPVEITDADESFEGWVQSCQASNFTPPCDGAYTMNEPIGAQSWYPSNNYPQDKATFETRVTVPATHVALGVGELERRTDNGDGTRTWDWTEDDPTATFLVSATVGLFDYSNSASFTEDLTGRNIPIYTAIDSAKNATSKANFATATAAIPAVMNFFGDRFGAYPFDSTGAVTDIAPDVGYALENQTKPHYASGLTSNSAGFSASTQAHELSHQWFGDAISPATWQQIWFSEGWATYSETAYAEDPASDETERLALFANVYSVPDDPDPAVEDEWSLPPAELGGPENLFDGFSVYARPGAMIEGFREILGGDEAFYAFAAGLQEGYRYGVITEEQFIAAAERASGFTGAKLALLDDYFEQWLHRDSKPTITPADFGSASLSRPPGGSGAITTPGSRRGPS